MDSAQSHDTIGSAVPRFAAELDHVEFIHTMENFVNHCVMKGFLFVDAADGDKIPDKVPPAAADGDAAAKKTRDDFVIQYGPMASTRRARMHTSRGSTSKFSRR